MNSRVVIRFSVEWKLIEQLHFSRYEDVLNTCFFFNVEWQNDYLLNVIVWGFHDFNHRRQLNDIEFRTRDFCNANGFIFIWISSNLDINWRYKNEIKQFCNGSFRSRCMKCFRHAFDDSHFGGLAFSNFPKRVFISISESKMNPN